MSGYAKQYEMVFTFVIKKTLLLCKFFVIQQFSLANPLHIAYSPLYSSTVSVLAKWTIANRFSVMPLGCSFSCKLGDFLRAENQWHFDGTGHLEGVRK